MDEAVLKYKSYEALEKVADGQATKIIVPTDLQRIATVATTFSEVMDKTK